MKIKFKSDFHRKAFLSFVSEKVKNPYLSRSEYIAAVFLLSADKFLWKCSESALTGYSVNFENLNLNGVSTEGYALFKAAKAVYSGDSDITITELCDLNLVDDQTAVTIFSGIMLSRNGIGLLNWKV